MAGGVVWGQSDGRTYVTCMVHSVGVRRNKITWGINSKVKGGGWRHGRRGGLEPVRWEDTCNLWCILLGLEEILVTGVLTVRLREWEHGKIGGEEGEIRYQKQPGHLSVLTHQRSMQYYETERVVAKRKPVKGTEFKPMTSAILVQCS